MDKKLEKWIRWLKIIHDDVRLLLDNRNIFWGVQEIIKNNQKIQRPSSFYRYLGDTYASYITIGIRRQIKDNKDSISLARLLTDLSKNPGTLTRDYYRSLYKGSGLEDSADQDFDAFFSQGLDYVCPFVISKDLETLRSAALIIEDFADKRIAHHDKRQPKELPRFHEVDECLTVLDKLCAKYHLLFHASHMDTLAPIYQYDWTEIFNDPWLPKSQPDQ